MDPLARRMLELIEADLVSQADRDALAAATRLRRNGQAQRSATWSTPQECVVELVHWVTTIPPEQLPPRLKGAAQYYGKSTRTVSRWLERAGIEGWEAFERYYLRAQRDLAGPTH